MEFLVLIIVLFMAKNLISSIINSINNSAPRVIDNLSSGIANGTDSLPTFGSYLAASHLIDLENELTAMNAKHNTKYTSFEDVVAKYRKNQNKIES